MDLGAFLRPDAADAVLPNSALRPAAGRRPLVLDLLRALLLDLVSSAPLIHEGASTAEWATQHAVVLPLVLRRRYPVGVFVVIALATLLQGITGRLLPGDLAILVALYTVATTRPRRLAIAAGVVVELGAIAAALLYAPNDEAVGRGLVLVTGLVPTALFLGTTQRNRRAYLASVEDRAERLERERDSQARLAVTAERTRIAREMHDVVAHSLSVMITLADGAALTAANDPARAAAVMEQVSATGRQSLAEMRRLVGVLRTESGADDLAPQPGLEQLDDLLSRTRKAGLPIHLTVSGAPRVVPDSVSSTVYRLVQEAMTNALKHGRQVSEVGVGLRWSDAALDVDVLNDGDDPDPVAGTGHGLVGMNERVQLFGGAVRSGPRPAGGWAVHAHLPLQQVGP